MCIAYVAFRAHPDWPLLIAANRDEFHDRACRPIAPWPEQPEVIAGIDLVGGGTWLGITRQGRFALLTNYRDPASVIPDAPSRGRLVSGFLTGSEAPEQYARKVSEASGAYNGFNLVVGDREAACYVGNRGARPGFRVLPEGRYLLSNHVLDTPWPKAQRLRRAMADLPLGQLQLSLTPVFEILKDGTRAADDVLPDTGIPLERERLLSSPFIVSPHYGTRCSTVIAIHASGRAMASEISYNADGVAVERHDWPFWIEKLTLPSVRKGRNSAVDPAVQ